MFLMTPRIPLSIRLSGAGEGMRACAGRLELILLAGALALIMIAQISASAPQILLKGYFWQDEQFTQIVASDPLVLHSIHAVMEGADSNPPTLHLLIRAFRALVPGPDEVVYRVFILLVAWVGLIATYAVLRRSFGILASATAVLALWAHPLIMREAFDARFYIPLFAAAALFCVVYRKPGSDRNSPFLVGLVALLLCGLHYFGIASLGAIVLGDLLFGGGTVGQKIRRALPAAVGAILALAMMVPFILGQRAGLSVATWVPDTRLDSFRDAADTLFAPLSLAIVLLAWGVAYWWHHHRTATNSASTDAAAAPAMPDLAPMTGLISLLLVPVVLSIFSLLVQPTLIPKYMITSTLALAPLMAVMASRIPRLGLVTLVGAIIMVGVMELKHEAWDRQQPWLAEQHRMVAECSDLVARGVPIVATSRREAYMLYYAAPQTRGHVFIADLRPLLRSQTRDDLVRHLIFETDFAAKYEKLYSVPPVIDVRALRGLGKFHLVGWSPWIAMFKEHLPLQKLPGDEMYKLPANPG